jgi:hypothetical protein
MHLLGVKKPTNVALYQRRNALSEAGNDQQAAADSYQIFH